MNFLSALTVCLNSSENFVCSWSCQESPSEPKRAWSDPSRFWRSRLKRCSSSAKRRTCSGSIMACGIYFPFLLKANVMVIMDNLQSKFVCATLVTEEFTAETGRCRSRTDWGRIRKAGNKENGRQTLAGRQVCRYAGEKTSRV